MTVEKLARITRDKLPVLISLRSKTSNIIMDQYFYVTAFDYDKADAAGRPEYFDPEIGASILMGKLKGQPGFQIATNPEEVKKEKVSPSSVFAINAKLADIKSAKQKIVRHLFDIENVL